MEIVSVVENDWGELKDIRLASLKDSPDAFAVSYETTLNYSDTEWKIRASGNGDRNFFIAKIDSLSVGIIGGIHGGAEYELISLWVSPSQRGNGIAKLLIDKIIEHAKELNRNSIFLEVASNNIAAVNLYQRFGFSLLSNSMNMTNGIDKVLNKFQLTLNT